MWRRLRRSSPITDSDLASTPRAETVAALTAREQARYRPRTLSANVTFVRADERDPLQCDPIAVWQRATHGEFHVVRTPGGHNDSLTLPHVAQLGKRLSALLDEA
jgi:thioesterase domain-containing protein